MILRFDRLQSTSTYLKANCEGLPQYAVVVAADQTAGRGQRGNSWESEPGKNLLLSMLYYPPASFHPANQFLISKVVSLAVARAVDRLLVGSEAPEVCVKWPNDIYVGDLKVCGILIEHSLVSASAIGHTVIGIGLNVNQREFRSGAPNPVSIISYTGKETCVDEALGILREELVASLQRLDGDLREIDREYRSRLWRRDGFHPYIPLVASLAPAPTAVKVEVAAEQGVFYAEIVDVEASGPLVLRLPDGETRRFNFKEVAPVL